MKFVVPITLKSEMNTLSHWSVRYKRFRQQGAAVLAFMRPHAPYPPAPLIVKLTRCYAGNAKIMDTDGCVSGFKGIRDFIADELGIDDGDVARLTFEYAQRRAEENGVEVSIQSRTPEGAK